MYSREDIQKGDLVIENIYQQIQYQMLTSEELDDIYNILVESLQRHMKGGH